VTTSGLLDATLPLFLECGRQIGPQFRTRELLENASDDRTATFLQSGLGDDEQVEIGANRHPLRPRLTSRYRLNALLNYLYALLEAETTLALHAAGLDPGLGIWHTDERHRDSLALDVMEAVRPAVDRYVLDPLTQTTFRARDFHETGRGVCRILPPLTHRLADAMPALAAAVEPIVVHLGRILDRGYGGLALARGSTGCSVRPARPSSKSRRGRGICCTRRA
jgi:hypothetical protein